MHCPRCGAAITGPGAFCEECGARIPQQPVSPVIPVGFQPVRPAARVDPGICLLISFIWTGAGFFLIPDRVTLGIVLAICAPVFYFVINFLGTLLFGIGLICTIPITIGIHIGIMIWTYNTAKAYAEGR